MNRDPDHAGYQAKVVTSKWPDNKDSEYLGVVNFLQVPRFYLMILGKGLFRILRRLVPVSCDTLAVCFERCTSLKRDLTHRMVFKSFDIVVPQ